MLESSSISTLSSTPPSHFSVRSVSAAEILDSRGTPTIEVTIALAGGVGHASIPSGKSTGRNEAMELRDGGSRYWGMGVRKAATGIERDIAPVLMGRPLPDQRTLDMLLCDLDGTPDKELLGANAILGVSLAAARARAAVLGLELFRALDETSSLLPVPCFNVLNGGAHADNGLEFQEFMVVPLGAHSFAEAVRAGAETYHTLARILKSDGLSISVGDEGGFAPAIAKPTDALDLLQRAITDAGYRPGHDVAIALDPAASAFYRDGLYHFGGQSYTAEQLTECYSDWLERYPIVSIEDGLAEDDLAGWAYLTRELGSRVQLVGDDIFVSNATRIAEGATSHLGNAVLLKPNQIGTLTEITEASEVAHSLRYRTMMSHRSGETDDTFIADLAVALGSGQIKAGAPARGERVAKYNRLMAIERSLGKDARYGGPGVFKDRPR